MKNAIQELMAVPTPARDIQWLKDSLQAAIELELSTLPPYLCGMWSIKNTEAGGTGEQGAKLIRGIVMQEMTHMGLVCNLLNAIGGSPKIASGYAENIRYPGPLPGGVRQELSVYLSGLTKTYVHDVYMEIEFPENGPLILATEFAAETFATIGEFYDAIQDAFNQLQPTLDTSKQLVSTPASGSVTVTKIATLADVEAAIKLIKEQGEGTPVSPAQSPNGDLAHYYLFAELYIGAKLKVGAQGGIVLEGSTMPFPDAITIAPIPANGYPASPAAVQALLTEFDSKFSRMLDKLDEAWQTGVQATLSASIGMMFQLKTAALKIMAKPLPQALDGFHGPTFKYVPAVAPPAPPVAPVTPTVANPKFADITQLLATLTGPGPELGFSPHGSFWNMDYDSFMAQTTDGWGVAGQLVVKGDPSASILLHALAGTGDFGTNLPQMPDTGLATNGRHATPEELQMVAVWITNNCPK